MRRLLIALAVGAASWLAAPAAEAACTISTTAVNFATYNVFASSPGDATGLITFRCSAPRPPLVTIDLDRGGAPSFNPRQMRNGSETLNYNLYLDSTRTTIWGDGTGGSLAFTQASPLPNRNINVPVYGRIPASQDVSAGLYTNTVTATINF